MPYTQPQNVKSPQKNLKIKKILYSGQQGSVAIAIVEWNGKTHLAIRRNGYNNWKEKGWPISSSNSIWLVLDINDVQTIINTLSAYSKQTY